MDENEVTNTEGQQETPATATGRHDRHGGTSDRRPGRRIDRREIRAEALVEAQRILRIKEICAGKHPEIEAQAIREGWEPERLRPGGPAGQPPEGAGTCTSAMPV